MKLLTFAQDDRLKLGIKTPKGVVEAPFTPSEFFARGNDALVELRAFESNLPDTTPYLAEQDLQLGPTVPNPGKILCVGLNLSSTCY